MEQKDMAWVTEKRKVWVVVWKEYFDERDEDFDPEYDEPELLNINEDIFSTYEKALAHYEKLKAEGEDVDEPDREPVEREVLVLVKKPDISTTTKRGRR